MIYNEELIISSDDDAPIMSSITIGETIRGELALCLEDHYNGDDDYFSIDENELTSVVFVIDPYELPIMAKRIGIPTGEVRNHLIEKFSDGGYISRRDYIQEVFQEMLNYVLDNGGKYRPLER